MKSIRSYKKLVDEIINLRIAYKVEIIGYVTYDKIYPILSLKYVSKLANKNIIITSGQHGDEPFGVATLIKWLKQPLQIPEFNYYIYPVINPFGFEKSCRDNGNQQDTNDDAELIKDSKVPELAVLYDDLPHTGDLIIDIHGDTGKEGVYLYEHKSDNLLSIAKKALIENDKLLPHLKTKTIYRTKLTDGVMIPPKKDIGLEAVFERFGASYSITIELPGKFDGQKRAEGGVAILNSILRNFKESENK